MIEVRNIGIVRFFTALIVTFLISGCSIIPAKQLNDPSRSTSAPHIATFDKTKNIPYETQEIGGIAVSYSLSFNNYRHDSGYDLKLIFKNNTDSPKNIAPLIMLQDADGMIIQPYSYSSYISQASMLAGIQVPDVPMRQSHSGTITSNNTGNSYRYTATSGGGFSGGFARGAAMRAQQDKNYGISMLRWADIFWLNSSYTLPPHSGASGALPFPASDLGKLPLSLTVEIGNNKYKFYSSVK